MEVAYHHNHYHEKEHSPIAPKLMLHPPDYPPLDCSTKSYMNYLSLVLHSNGIMGQQSQVVMHID